jgi:hypothetical protein
MCAHRFVLDCLPPCLPPSSPYYSGHCGWLATGSACTISQIWVGPGYDYCSCHIERYSVLAYGYVRSLPNSGSETDLCVIFHFDWLIDCVCVWVCVCVCTRSDSFLMAEPSPATSEPESLAASKQSDAAEVPSGEPSTRNDQGYEPIDQQSSSSASEEKWLILPQHKKHTFGMYSIFDSVFVLFWLTPVGCGAAHSQSVRMNNQSQAYKMWCALVEHVWVSVCTDVNCMHTIFVSMKHIRGWFICGNSSWKLRGDLFFGSRFLTEMGLR